MVPGGVGFPFVQRLYHEIAGIAWRLLHSQPIQALHPVPARPVVQGRVLRRPRRAAGFGGLPNADARHRRPLASIRCTRQVSNLPSPSSTGTRSCTRCYQPASGRGRVVWQPAKRHIPLRWRNSRSELYRPGHALALPPRTRRRSCTRCCKAAPGPGHAVWQPAKRSNPLLGRNSLRALYRPGYALAILRLPCRASCT